jgi:hypothetical protein
MPAGAPRAPRWAHVIDVFCIVAAVLAVSVAAGDGFHLRLFGWRVAITSPFRVFGWAVAAAVIRHLLAPRPPIHRNLAARIVSWRDTLESRPAVRTFLDRARAPLPLGEINRFERPGHAGRPLGEWSAVVLGISLVVAAFTWPQVRRMDSVPDLGDPLFSIWRLSWINHQLPRHPAALFDANIFYPERLTLTYSDPLLIPALMSAPFVWLGLDRVLIYNSVFLSAWVLSGAAMYLLVRTLTGRRDAAFVAGVVFTLYPYRFDHYSHLELQMTMWMPLALWALHRTLAQARMKDGMATGCAFALQMLSSLYYGMYFAVYLVVVGGALWAGRYGPLRAVTKLAAGAVVAAVLIAPIAIKYQAGRTIVGERDETQVLAFSAVGRDYLEPSRQARVYQRWADPDRHERRLFPGVTAVALAVIGIWPPMSVATIAYTSGLALTFDASLGMNGAVFPWLRGHVPGYRSLRAATRFSILGGMTLAILSGYGATRLFRRWPRARFAILGAIAMATTVEALADIRLERVPRQPPAIYGSLTADSPRVLAEFPTSEQTGNQMLEPQFMYFATFHWQKLVNGYSGYFPASFIEFQRQTRDFPSDAALQYLRDRGVEYIGWHGTYTDPGRAERTAAILDARPDLELVATAPWQGSESRLYRLR